MNLAEEYFQRHGIKIPFAKHVYHGNLFLRSEQEGKILWKVLNIDNIPDTSHPGKYFFQLLAPVHNGLSDKNRMFESIATAQAEWDDYEEYWGRWAKEVDKKILVKNSTEAYLTAWEIYVYCYDKEIARFIGQESLHKSLSLSLDGEERLKGCTDIISFISEHNCSIMEVWKNSMLPMLRNYCFWLVDLVNFNQNGVV